MVMQLHCPDALCTVCCVHGCAQSAKALYVLAWSCLPLQRSYSSGNGLLSLSCRSSQGSGRQTAQRKAFHCAREIHKYTTCNKIICLLIQQRWYHSIND